MDKILMTKIFTKYEPNTRVNDKNYHKNPPKPKSPDPRPQATFLITHPERGTELKYKNMKKKSCEKSLIRVYFFCGKRCHFFGNKIKMEQKQT